jgi:hypothetical protein
MGDQAVGRTGLCRRVEAGTRGEGQPHSQQGRAVLPAGLGAEDLGHPGAAQRKPREPRADEPMSRPFNFLSGSIKVADPDQGQT